MTALPIMDRELRLRSRARTTYWTRFAVGLMGALVGLPQLVFISPTAAPASIGRQAFNGIVAAAFLLCCGACLLTADMISGERREGTLGLLLLTRVRSLDVLIGKLGSIGVSSFCALIALLPVLMVPVLVGGVGGAEATRTSIALLNTLFFALAAGLWASAAQEARFKAARDALAVMVVAVFAPFILEGIIFKQMTASSLAVVSPLAGILAAADKNYNVSPAAYWVTLAAVHIAGWLLLFGAGARLRYAICEGRFLKRSAAKKPVAMPPPMLSHRHWPPPTGDEKPIEWLIERNRVNGLVWSVAALGLAYSGWVSLGRSQVGFLSGGTFWVLVWPLGIAGGLLGGAVVSWVASRFFLEARRTRELELLLTTPLGANEVLARQWSELKRLFPWPVLVMQAPILVQAVPAASAGSPMLVLLALNLVNIFIGVKTLCWLGMWLGLRARNQAIAIAWAVSLALGVPYLIELLFLVLFPAPSNLPLSFPSSSLSLNPVFYLAGMWLPRLLTLGFFFWLLRVAQRGLAVAMAGAEPKGLVLGPPGAEFAVST